MDFRPDLTVSFATTITRNNANRSRQVASAADVAIINARLHQLLLTLALTAHQGASLRQEQFNAALALVLWTLAETGTSPETTFDGLSLPFEYQTAPPLAGAAPIDARAATDFGMVIDEMFIDDGITIRQYARHYANNIHSRARALRHVFPVGVRHGVPANYGHLGFDFADGISVSRLSINEQLVVRRARAVGLFNNNASAINLDDDDDSGYGRGRSRR
jgi:hypothetical protein